MAEGGIDHPFETTVILTAIVIETDTGPEVEVEEETETIVLTTEKIIKTVEMREITALMLVVAKGLLHPMARI